MSTPNSERINTKNDMNTTGIDENKVFSEKWKIKGIKRSKLGPTEWVTYFRKRRGNQKAWFIAPWSNKSQPGKRVVRHKTFLVICLFKHQIDKSSKISPYPQCILQLRTLLKSPDSQHPHCQTDKDRTTRCVLVLFHTTQGLRALERLQRNKPPSPHFKKNRKISYSLSRISTIIMGFRSQ